MSFKTGVSTLRFVWWVVRECGLFGYVTPARLGRVWQQVDEQSLNDAEFRERNLAIISYKPKPHEPVGSPLVDVESIVNSLELDKQT